MYLFLILVLFSGTTKHAHWFMSAKLFSSVILLYSVERYDVYWEMACWSRIVKIVYCVNDEAKWCFLGWTCFRKRCCRTTARYWCNSKMPWRGHPGFWNCSSRVWIWLLLSNLLSKSWNQWGNVACLVQAILCCQVAEIINNH